MPPEDPREKRGRDGLWKVPPPWEPAAKPARSHRGLEAFGFHTFHSPDGGLTYKPLTQGVGPFYSIGVGSFYVVKAKWVQNNENEQWDEDEVNGKLKRIMTTATDDIIEKQTEINGSLVELEIERVRQGRGDDPLDRVDLRTAAFVMAVERVARVALDRGVWP